METKGKFVMQATGPILTYRLEILRKVCPVSRHFVIVLTNKFSYDEFYKDFHDFFEFVIMDDYRSDKLISLEYEQFPEFKTEEEFFQKIHTFYGNQVGKFYPFDIHRFIFPYLIEKNILNFAIVDSDFIMADDFDLLNKFFDNVPVGTVYGPWHGEDPTKEQRMKMWESIQPNFPQIKLDSPFLRTCDGWMRGFHFRNLEQMELLYNLWNSGLDATFTNNLYGHGSVIICQTEWVISHIMQFFEHQLGYNFVNAFSLIHVEDEHREIGRHYSRVEDTIYTGPKHYWDYHNFDYSDTTTISSFIKNNKEQLKNFYAGAFREIEITDNFVYTKFA